MWRAEAGERRNEIHAAVIGDAGREFLDFRRGFDDAEPIAQPLHGGARREDRALEGIRRTAGFKGVRDRSEQAALAAHDLRARVQH